MRTKRGAARRGRVRRRRGGALNTTREWDMNIFIHPFDDGSWHIGSLASVIVFYYSIDEIPARSSACAIRTPIQATAASISTDVLRPLHLGRI